MRWYIFDMYIKALYRVLNENTIQGLPQAHILYRFAIARPAVDNPVTKSFVVPIHSVFAVAKHCDTRVECWCTQLPSQSQDYSLEFRTV